MSNQPKYLGFGASASVIKQKNTVQKLFFNEMEHKEVENINYIKEKIKPYPEFLIDYTIKNDSKIQYGKKLVMPYLSEKDGWKMGIVEDYDIYKKIRNALIKLHNIGFYHNDIKRENIFINTETNEIKLIDFDYSLNDDIIDKVYNKNDKKEIRDFNILTINLFPCFCEEVRREYDKFKNNEEFYIEKEIFKNLLKLNDLYSLDKNLFYFSGDQYKKNFENQMKKEKKMDHELPIVFPTMLEILKKTPDYDTFVKTDKNGNFINPIKVNIRINKIKKKVYLSIFILYKDGIKLENTYSMISSTNNSKPCFLINSLKNNYSYNLYYESKKNNNNVLRNEKNKNYKNENETIFEFLERMIIKINK